MTPPPQLTVLTPTYNRRHLLERVYASLLAQDAPAGSFEWLVIDDGSTDGTEGHIAGLVAQAPFPVRVVRQENGGKCSALNLGARLAQGRWIAVLDSDDQFLPAAVRLVCDSMPAAEAGGCAIIFAQSTFVNRPARQFALVQNPWRYSAWVRSRDKFDCLPVLLTTQMREYPYPLFPDEKFMAEGWQYLQIDKTFRTLFITTPVILCEYNDDGLSAQSRKLRMASPNNAMSNYAAEWQADLGWRLRLRAAVNFWRFHFHAMRRGAVAKMPKRPTWLMVPFGYASGVIDLISARRQG
ncbi:MAG: glycosyltransferase family 2 protein [Rhodobacterales bacterium]|nr:glycosyltransferase family 2 protein [Rhodobacterales bacterium]